MKKIRTLHEAHQIVCLLLVLISSLGSVTCRSTPSTSPPSGFNPKKGQYILGMPARYQWDFANGYCGEVSIQTILLKHGIWVSQRFARKMGDGELLLHTNYEKALKRLHIQYKRFKGRNATAFFQFARTELMASHGVVGATLVDGGTYPDYDHIVPFVGYDANKNIFVANSLYGPTRNKTESKFICPIDAPARNQTGVVFPPTEDGGGCVPPSTTWGFSLLGPIYKTNDGIQLDLAMKSPSEPTRAGLPLEGSLKISGLKSGQKYKLFMIESLNELPKDAKSKINMVPFAQIAASSSTVTEPVTVKSGGIAYFIIRPS